METPRPEENSVEKKNGENVKIVLKLIRHGERTKDGELTDYGREVTADLARGAKVDLEQFDAVKAIGSTAGPKGPTGMQRSLETADIYAHELAGDKTFQTRARDILSYEGLKTPTPYNHAEIYNAALPADFNDLSDEDKARAAKIAQTEVVNHLIQLDTPEAEQFRREVAGSFAHLIDHYERAAKRLKPDSKVLMVAGTHGGTMELLLQQALVWEDENGNERIGFSNLEDIGGEFDPSDSYNVEIETDEGGNIKDLSVTFDNPNRPILKNAKLDREKLKELSELYESLHRE